MNYANWASHDSPEEAKGNQQVLQEAIAKFMSLEQHGDPAVCIAKQAGLELGKIVFEK